LKKKVLSPIAIQGEPLSFGEEEDAAGDQALP
jgi:hypothetical protein